MFRHLTAGADPGAVALVSAQGEGLTYGDLAAAVDRAAGALRRAGAGPGRVVGVAGEEAAGALIALLAASETGAVIWPLDARTGAAGRLEAERRARPVVVVTGATPAGDLSLAAPAGEPRTLAPAAGMLLFTSGTSGAPKGVVLGRTGILANVEAILAYLPVRTYPRTALVLPMTYSYAIVGQAFVTLRAGGTLLLLSGLTYPIRQVEAMARLGASGLSSVPTSLRRICEAAAELPAAERPPLGYLASAGAPLDPVTLAAMRAAFPGARRFNQYGLTEACPRVSALSDDEAAFAAGSVGRPLPGITVHAVDAAGRRLPPGEVGELVVQGPSVMLGYLDDPDGTGRVLGPDGLKAGDTGWVDESGYLYVTGRRDGVVKVAGERVSLEEVAAVVRMAPGVGDAYVVAVPDELLGARLVAFIEPAGASDAIVAVRQALKEHLPPAKRPQKLIQLSSLPRSDNGKVELGTLRHQAQQT